MKQKKNLLNSIHVPDLMGATGVSLLNKNGGLEGLRIRGLGEEWWVGRSLQVREQGHRRAVKLTCLPMRCHSYQLLIFLRHLLRCPLLFSVRHVAVPWPGLQEDSVFEYEMSPTGPCVCTVGPC